MSRIAKYPVPLPKGVEVSVAGGNISVKGPLGTIARAADPNVAVEKKGEAIEFRRSATPTTPTPCRARCARWSRAW